ncbi:NIPA-like protein 2 [Synchiropus splendidus]|uniref:NIPA-like protein 2 n=1 Tax=Synchiropus splendidus TaxID=270530 RepID=UPI00237ED25A|nr:NIPA-like protein 2 [Synchiropus splendidus]
MNKQSNFLSSRCVLFSRNVVDGDKPRNQDVKNRTNRKMTAIPTNYEVAGNSSAELDAHRAEILENPLQTYLLGIIISICGNVLISISLNIQKYAHVLQSQRGSRPYYTSFRWWCGVVLMGVGELGNFAAYGFAPASLIAPLGCVSVIASAIISVVFLKETVQSSDIVGCTLAITGTYVLVTFAPHTSTHVTAHLVQYYLISWQFLLYVAVEVTIFSILLYVYKWRKVKHIVIVILLVALLASATVISVKAVSGMITETIKGDLQLIYPIFYVMVIIMVASCAFQIKFLNQAMKMFDATEVVPINFVFFTASAIVAGVVFYQEFEGLAALNIFMFLFGCLLSFLGVFLIARNRPKNRKQQDVNSIPMEKMPGSRQTEEVEPDEKASTYGSLADKFMCNRGPQTDDS